jgi:hypothetical protein
MFIKDPELHPSARGNGKKNDRRGDHAGCVQIETI